MNQIVSRKKLIRVGKSKELLKQGLGSFVDRKRSDKEPERYLGERRDGSNSTGVRAG
jgi:hypothetical protein